MRFQTVLPAVLLPIGGSFSTAASVPRTELKASNAGQNLGHSALLRPWEVEFEPPSVQVNINGIPRWLTVDTGSADLVIYTENTTCVLDGKKLPQAKCNWGDLYYGTYEPVKNLVFNQTYGSGLVIAGQFGYASVEVAGITIKRQKVAFATVASPGGFAGTSGIMGLAPYLVEAAYAAAHPSQASVKNRVFYPTVFESMYNVTKQVEPVFSLALQSDPQGGYLTFGGLPPLPYNNSFVNSTLEGINISGKENSNLYYPIQPEGYMLNGVSYNTTYRAVVDSGTFPSRLPEALADKFNAAFDPPAVFNNETSLYITSCNATVPKFGITIGGTTFHASSKNLLRSYGSERTKCGTGVTKGFDFDKTIFPDGFYVLSDLFLVDLVAVFDVGKKEVRFAQQL